MLQAIQCRDDNLKQESPAHSRPAWIWLALSFGLHLALLIVPVSVPQPIEPLNMMVVQLYEVAPILPEPPPVELTLPEPIQESKPAATPAPLERKPPLDPEPTISEPDTIDEPVTPDPPVNQVNVTEPPTPPAVEPEVEPPPEQPVGVEESVTTTIEQLVEDSEPERISESVSPPVLTEAEILPEPPEEIIQEEIELPSSFSVEPAEVIADERELPAQPDQFHLPVPVTEPVMVKEQMVIDMPMEQPTPPVGSPNAATADPNPPSGLTAVAEDEAEIEPAGEEVLQSIPLPPQVLTQTEPVYPLRARRRGWSGEVTLTVQVLATGLVGQVQVERTSGYTILDEAAVEAVRSWLFAPAMRGSEPIDGEIPVIVRFTLE